MDSPSVNRDKIIGSALSSLPEIVIPNGPPYLKVENQLIAKFVI